MSFLFIFIKLYPLFGFSLAILCFDLARAYKRKANKLWIGYLMFTVIFIVTVGLWIYYRGDLHEQEWFNFISSKFKD